MPKDHVVESIVELARLWADTEYLRRVDAVEKTLACPNRFTLEAVTFAINQQTSVVKPATLRRLLGDTWTDDPLSVAVLNAGNVPLAGMQDLLAVVGSGNLCRGVVSSKSPFLLPAIGEDLNDIVGRELVSFSSLGKQLDAADALIATGSDETINDLTAVAASAGLTSDRCLFRGHRHSVAIIDGAESPSEIEGLAEDMLLHEGMGCRSVAIVWAPGFLGPDDILSALATFRAVFPAHTVTASSLKMPAALLAATEQPHAVADDFSFLLSKGAPEAQQPGHVRWSPYESVAEVSGWLVANVDRLQIVVATDRVARRFGLTEHVRPGDSQRPPLWWQPDGLDTVRFLADQHARLSTSAEGPVYGAPAPGSNRGLADW